MKWFLVFLTGFGVLALLSAVTGIEGGYPGGSGYVIVHRTVIGRVLVGSLGAFLLWVAFACRRREGYAWYIVDVLLLLYLVTGLSWEIFFVFAWKLPMSERFGQMYGQALKLALVCWLRFKFWARQRKSFGSA